VDGAWNAVRVRDKAAAKVRDKDVSRARDRAAARVRDRAADRVRDKDVEWGAARLDGAAPDRGHAEADPAPGNDNERNTTEKEK